MAKVKHLPENTRLPEWFLDEVQEFLSSYASPNLVLSILNPTTLQVAAGAGDAQVCVAVGSPADATVYGWRWNAAAATAAAPGTLAVGDNDVYVVSAANGPYVANGAPPPTELDQTVLTFGLVVLPPGTPPSGTGAQAYYRKIGTATWSGTAFTDVRQSVGGAALPKHEAQHLPGGTDPLPWTTITAQGTLGARPTAGATNAGFTYLATDVAGGTVYRSNGAAWTQQAAGVTQAPQPHQATHQAGGTDALPWATILGSGTLAARPVATNALLGYYYYATDTGGLSQVVAGPAWSARATIPFAHQTSHVAGGTDALPWTTINGAGTLAARPAAAAGNAGYVYFATDVAGGVLYRSDGAAWTAVARTPWYRGADLAVVANAVAPLGPLHRVSGSPVTINTITNPANIPAGFELTLISTGTTTFLATGNIWTNSAGTAIALDANDAIKLVWNDIQSMWHVVDVQSPQRTAQTIHLIGTLAARPAAGAANSGFLYYATDTGLIYRSNGGSWDSLSQSNTAIATAIHPTGTLAARPAAAAGNAGFVYLATDVSGGTLYRSDGAAWTQSAHGVNIAAGEVTNAMLAGSIDPAKVAGTAVITSDARLSDQRTPLANSVDSSKIVDGSIVGGDIAAGTVAGGANWGTALPSSGLFNGYRFTLFWSNLAWDFIYRADIDATNPWVFVGGSAHHVELAGGSTTSTSPVNTANGTLPPWAGYWDVDIEMMTMTGGQTNAPVGYNEVNVNAVTVFISDSHVSPAGGSQNQMRSFQRIGGLPASAALANYIKASVSDDTISTGGSQILVYPYRIH